MSLYAYVYENEIVEFKELPDDLYQSWVLEENPKKDVFKIVVFNDKPQTSNTQVAEESWVLNENSAVQTWTVRDKTSSELIKKWTAYQFLLRFTAEERAAFRAASLTDPNVADFQQLAQAAQEVISNDPMTVAGMNYLVSLGLLTEQRKLEILGSA